MKKYAMLWTLLTAVALMTILAGCSQATPTALPTSTPVTPTVDVQPTFNTVRTEAVSTFIVQMTQNAPTATMTSTPTQTATPAPTETQGPTITPTHAFIPWTKTPTSAPSAYNCTVTAVKHMVGSSSVNTVPVNTDFDTVWSLKNSGTTTWSHDLDIVFVSGDDLNKKTLYDMPHDVAPNGTLDVTVDMKAQANDGTYTNKWAINFPDGTACTLSTSVNITK